MTKRIRVNGGGKDLINYRREGSDVVCCDTPEGWEEYELKLKISGYGVPDNVIDALARIAYRRGYDEAADEYAQRDASASL